MIGHNNDYWVVRGSNITTVFEQLSKLDSKDLAQLIVNNRVNDFVTKYADFSEGDNDPRGHGKRIPYIGWYWRSVDFVTPQITIGDCGSFIGIMENNKWGYSERILTAVEAEKVTNIIWEAKELSEQGGQVSEIAKNTENKISELWDLLQTFKI
jgi:hypothetical protein